MASDNVGGNYQVAFWGWRQRFRSESVPSADQDRVLATGSRQRLNRDVRAEQDSVWFLNADYPQRSRGAVLLWCSHTAIDSEGGHAPAIGASSIGTRRLLASQNDSARVRPEWRGGMLVAHLPYLRQRQTLNLLSSFGQ